MNPEPASTPVSGVILAGGLSRRFGVDKRRLKLWGDSGPTLLEHTVSILAPLCAEVIVVLNDPDAWTSLESPAVRLVPDALDGGALGGLYTGLNAATHPYALVVAADMPMLNPALLAMMLAQSRTYDALVPRASGEDLTRNRLQAQTLHAIYCRETIGLLRSQLDQGVRRISDYLAAINTVFIEPDVIHPIDPDGRSFININTPDDLERVRGWLASNS